MVPGLTELGERLGPWFADGAARAAGGQYPAERQAAGLAARLAEACAPLDGPRPTGRGGGGGYRAWATRLASVWWAGLTYP